MNKVCVLLSKTFICLLLYVSLGRFNVGASCFRLYLEFRPEIHGQIWRITDFHCPQLLNDICLQEGIYPVEAYIREEEVREEYKSGAKIKGSFMLNSCSVVCRLDCILPASWEIELPGFTRFTAWLIPLNLVLGVCLQENILEILDGPYSWLHVSLSQVNIRGYSFVLVMSRLSKSQTTSGAYF